MNIGAGRVVYQDYTRIERAIETGEFFENPVLTGAVAAAKAKARALHVLGLVSPGGVHSHESQIHAMLDLAARSGLREVYVHAFLDGRDTPPRSAEASLAALDQKCRQLGKARIASIRVLMVISMTVLLANSLVAAVSPVAATVAGNLLIAAVSVFGTALGVAVFRYLRPEQELSEVFA